MKHLFLLSFFLITNLIFSQKINVKGSWTLTLKASDISLAGYDYNSFYESSNKETTIDIKPVPSSKYNKKFMRFKVYVNKEDINWDKDLKLLAKVSSTSHGNSTGTIYQEITNYSNSFFETIGEQKKIPIQYRIEGLSVTLPAEDYSTEIIYTVLNI
ncbi:hypothetical protein [Lutibacter citreus]|uniref:hypothetical protein n=1 Tax=Lutibacter citreus TaxID=2138210 RepID=UPI000DBE2752|nr:hypothetical protein [Lutibacter citreus]